MGAEEKQKHLDQWKTSGLTQKAYCREYGIKYSTFGYWLKVSLQKCSNNISRDFIELPQHISTSKSIELTFPNGVILRMEV